MKEYVTTRTNQITFKAQNIEKILKIKHFAPLKNVYKKASIILTCLVIYFLHFYGFKS